MNPPDPDLKEFFNQALHHPDGHDRSTYLGRACQDDDSLRLQVESLLKAHDEAGSSLRSADPGATASLDPPPILEGPSTAIGPYKLLQQIGEGGMGVVFMAEQEKPVRRKK